MIVQQRPLQPRFNIINLDYLVIQIFSEVKILEVLVILLKLQNEKTFEDKVKTSKMSHNSFI